MSTSITGRSLVDDLPDPDDHGHPHEGDRAGTGRWGDRLFGGAAKGSGIFVVLLVSLVGLFLVIQAVPSLMNNNANFLTSTEWIPSGSNPRFGIAALLWATVITSVIAMAIAVPLGVAVALFITEYAPTWLSKPAAVIIDLLAAVPSIVFGFWGLSVAGQYFEPVKAFMADYLGWIPFFADAGPSALNLMSIVKKVIAPLLISPLAGFTVGFLMMVGISIAFFRVDRRFVNRFFRKSQMASAGIMALSHGLNDAQKTMGVITLALLIFGKIDVVHVPLWVKLACALAMAAGTAVGGWKIVKTMGHKIFKLEPVHGFAAETSAAMVIGCASAFGAPISTTHTITACIFGVGSTKRLSAVRWGIAGHLIIAWVLTIPASAAVGAVSFLLLEAFEKLL